MTKRIADDELVEVNGGTDVITRLDDSNGGTDSLTRQSTGGRTGGGSGIGGENEQQREYEEKKSQDLF